MRVDGGAVGVRLLRLLCQPAAIVAATEPSATAVASATEPTFHRLRRQMRSGNWLDLWQVVFGRVRQEQRVVHVLVDEGAVELRVRLVLREPAAFTAAAAACTSLKPAPPEASLHGLRLCVRSWHGLNVWQMVRGRVR